MSGLYASLNSTVKALGAHSRALEIAGKNVANVDNPGYARQRVVFGDRGTVLTPTGAESLGMEALAVEQLRDSLLDRQVLRETALKSGFLAEQAGYQRAQAGLGQSIDRTTNTADATSTGTGVAGAIDSFFNAFQGFAANPTGVGERQNARPTGRHIRAIASNSPTSGSPRFRPISTPASTTTSPTPTASSSRSPNSTVRSGDSRSIIPVPLSTFATNARPSSKSSPRFCRLKSATNRAAKSTWW